jgi:hypothetical protein
VAIILQVQQIHFLEGTGHNATGPLTHFLEVALEVSIPPVMFHREKCEAVNTVGVGNTFIGIGLVI